MTVHRSDDDTVTATHLYYDAWNLIQEGPSSATADRIYAHGNRVDEVVASQYGGAWRYHHYDARGHCILLTDASGNIVEQYDYNAFGKPYFYDATGTALPNGSSLGNRFLFTGREWLKEIGVYDFRNRHYLPELGRFIQPDPKHFEAGDYNLYRYCHNDPVNKTDPTGEFFVVDDVAEAYAIAAVGAAATAYLSSPAGRKMLQDTGRTIIEISRKIGEAARNLTQKVTDVPGKPRFQGEPDSIERGPKQTRQYDGDGYPSRDVDSGHDHGAGDPHAHDWGRPEGGGRPSHTDRGEGRPIKPSDPPPPRNSPKHQLRANEHFS